MEDENISKWPEYSRDVIDAVGSVLASGKVNYWTGNNVELFEEEFARFADSRHAIGLANGTVALDLALMALDVGPGDEVVVTPRSFIASASCVVNCSATPVFADVDLNNQAMTDVHIEKKITKKTKAIILVHVGGDVADIEPILRLAEHHGIYIIEDCSQAHGAKFKGKSVGSYGDIATWSFCQDKIISTGGEGGMITTNDTTLYEKMWSIKDHGKNIKLLRKDGTETGVNFKFKWVHDTFGTNFRMNEIQAVIGREQLKVIEGWSEKRRANAEFVWSVCRYYTWLRVPETNSDVIHAAYRAYVFVELDKLPSGWDRDKVVLELNRAGVRAFVGTCSEIYLEKSFTRYFGGTHNRLRNARRLGDTSIALLTHPTTTDAELERLKVVFAKIDKKMEGLLDV